MLSVAARGKLYLLQLSTAFIYGLKQAPRYCNKKFNDFLIKEAFKSSFADPCSYIRNQNRRKLITVLYVDVGLIAS